MLVTELVVNSDKKGGVTLGQAGLTVVRQACLLERNQVVQPEGLDAFLSCSVSISEAHKPNTKGLILGGQLDLCGYAVRDVSRSLS